MSGADAGENGSANQSAIVRLERVTKRYGTHPALVEVDLRLGQGEFLVLLGPSGSGKSTLLRSVAGIERISQGKLWVADSLVDDGRRVVPPEQRSLAMVFQDYALWPHMTVRENVRYALRRRRLPSTEGERRTGELLERVGLGTMLDRYPGELSGGEQQRVALARAMVGSPRVLLFDEPLSNLDAGLRDRMRVEIATLVRDSGASALYITHDQGEAFALADRIGVLNGGRLVQIGTPEEIYAKPASPFVARLTGLAGEIIGRVHGSAPDGVARVAVGSISILARLIQPVLPGSQVRVMVRASAVQILGRTASDSQFPGVIRDVAFSGRGYEHVIEILHGTRLVGAFSDTRHERGSEVGCKLTPGGCVLFGDQESVLGGLAQPDARDELGRRLTGVLST